MSVQEESMRNESVPEKSITECEVMVMKCIWFRESACTASGILVDLEERYQKRWKPQTISTFLRRLVDKGYLSMERSGRTFLYTPLVSELDYGSEQIEKCAEFWSANDADLFLAARNRQRPITTEEAARIRALLDSIGK